MPMELYSSEAFVRDLVNAISKSEGRPLNIGGRHQGIDRDYAFRLISEAKKAIEGSYGQAKPAPSVQDAAARSAAVRTLMAKTEDDGGKAPRRAPAGKKAAAP
ncbi:MAG: hypothetical protein ACRYGM_00640 [Janthinobacterium lividum]